jgi:hypothetical protein
MDLRSLIKPLVNPKPHSTFLKAALKSRRIVLAFDCSLDFVFSPVAALGSYVLSSAHSALAQLKRYEALNMHYLSDVFVYVSLCTRLALLGG